MNVNKLTLKTIKLSVKKAIAFDFFPLLERSVVELNSFEELKKIYRWSENPILDRPDIYDFEALTDVNERRIRDAEALAVVMKNAQPKVALEIGTSSGMGTALMAVNAPESMVYTLNIPPEEILAGQGGKLTTIALEKEKIGAIYRERGLKNIEQIYANSESWSPNIGNIDVAFVDGCHDTEFVYNDTLKILKNMQPGGFILWHDFSPELVKRYDWIHSVCLGVERLFQHGYLNHEMFHIRDSWTGIYQV